MHVLLVPANLRLLILSACKSKGIPWPIVRMKMAPQCSVWMIEMVWRDGCLPGWHRTNSLYCRRWDLTSPDWHSIFLHQQDTHSFKCLHPKLLPLIFGSFKSSILSEPTFSISVLRPWEFPVLYQVGFSWALRSSMCLHIEWSSSSFCWPGTLPLISQWEKLFDVPESSHMPDIGTAPSHHTAHENVISSDRINFVSGTPMIHIISQDMVGPLKDSPSWWQGKLVEYRPF